MPIYPHWSDIAIRLICAAGAGFLIGWDRDQHGRPAGLRTTCLVSLAACVAMIQANLLMDTAGKAQSSFVVLDLMRLPLGILSGMGFIGAGAIVHRENLVLGVTTAATMWFVTVLGLCFGGGQIALGLTGLGLGIVVLRGLRHFEQHLKQERHGVLVVETGAAGPTEDEIRQTIRAHGYEAGSCAVVYCREKANRELTCPIVWRAVGEGKTPEFVAALSAAGGVARVAWKTTSQ